MPLTDAQIRNAKPRAKPYKLTDGGGLYLMVQPSGSRLWRYKYRVNGAEKKLAIGIYPDVNLKTARDRHVDARRLVEAGKDPSAIKREVKEDNVAHGRTFRVVAKEWLAVYVTNKKPSPATLDKINWVLDAKLYPAIGDKRIDQLTARDLLDAILVYERSGNLETAHRMRQRLGNVFRFARKHGYIEHNPAPDLAGELMAQKVRHHPGITDPRKFGELLRAMDAWHGQPATVAAMRLCPYVFLRPKELRMATWDEFDLDGAVWRIGGERMKMSEEHIVPLPRQAVAILKQLHDVTGPRGYVFPSLKPDRPMSENTITAALYTLGYKGVQSWHGFRTSASTMLNEADYPGDWVELQLSHKPKDKVRGAYNRAVRLRQRAEMLQNWADYIDALRENRAAVLTPNS